MAGVDFFTAFSGAMNGANTGMTLAAQQQANQVKDRVTDYEVDALKRRAEQERASADVKAGAERDKAERMIALQRARTAAGGGGMGGSSGAIIANTAARGSLNADMRLWEGNEAAIGLENKAAMTRYAAGEEQKGRGMEMASTILKGVSKTFEASAKTGAKKPNKHYYDDAGTTPNSWERGTTVTRYG